MFENHRKSLTQTCERSELRLHIEWTKLHQKWQKWPIRKPEACGQTVLPEKLVENART